MRINTIILIVLICSHNLVVCFANTSSNPEERYTESLLINADAIRRNNSLKYIKVFQDAMVQLKSTDKKRYKEVKAKYRSAKFLYRKYKFLAKETDKKIRLLRKNNPELIEQLILMQGASSERIIAYVGSKVRFSSKESLGDTHIRFEIPHDTPLPTLGLEAEAGLLLLPPQHNVIKITLATDASLPDCKHELGHFAYVVVKPKSYYRFLKQSVASSCGDGHTHGDPSGAWALQFEKL